MASWLTRVWRRGRERPAGPPEGATPVVVAEAVRALEGRVCDGLAWESAPRWAAGTRSDAQPPQPLPRNVFGRRVQEEWAPGAAERVSLATGLAMAGLRTAVFLRGGELLEVGAALRGCARRHVPLVVHADAAGGDGGLAPAGAGCFEVAAASGQDAVDWALLAHWLAERALIPALVSGMHDAVDTLLLPDEEALAAFLGRPEDPIESPSEAQRILFGRERRRVLPWFDLDRPVATGGLRSDPDAEQARLADHHYFWTALPDLLLEGAGALERVTGRSLRAVETHGMDGAEVVLVAQGAAVQTACAVASRLRRQRGARIGVLAMSVLRPFPAADVARALEGRRDVAVIDAASSPSEAPLLREIATAAGHSEGWVSATCAPGGPQPQAVAALCELLRKDERPRHVHLERLAAPISTGYPRRDVLVQAATRAYPELSQSPLPEIPARPPEQAPEAPSREPAGARAGERPLPRLVSRVSRIRESHDSLPRFWGEVVQPAQEGAPAWPDPLTAVGAAPAGASALSREPLEPPLPVLDAGACTACGKCWSACPDSAIGVTALGVEPLLTAASRIAGTQGREADALRRAHKHLAGRIGTELSRAGGGRLDADTLARSWEWLAGKLGPSEEERPAYEAAASATFEVLERLQPVVSDALYREAEGGQKGSGALLVLAVDPRACVGCKLCVAECPEDALRLEERTPERIEAFHRRWQGWEELPDTAGDTLSRAAEQAEPGPLAATLLSRHCAQAQVGGGDGEPGSGERLAGRVIAAFAEAHSQRRTAALLESIEERRARLEQKVREQLGAALSEPALGTLQEAAAGIRRGRAPLGDLVEQLDALGSRTTFDRQTVLRATRAAARLDDYRERLVEGRDGLGRARFGVVVAGARTAEWAARFPGHPYFAPLTLTPTREGAELARGVARALTAQHVELVRALRRAELEVEAPPDRPARLDALHDLEWSDLDPEERASCPPLLLLADDGALLDRGFEQLTRLLSGDLPVKGVLLDGRGRVGGASEPALLAMAHRRAFVLSGSLAHGDHLARGLRGAFAWPGPAFVHVHAPSPQEHGFPAEAALERARLAVESRAHLLLCYDPAAEGVFGLRASLDGNPRLDSDWGGLTFGDWAAGESRFAGHFEPVEEGTGTPLAEWLALPKSARRGVPTVEHDGRRLAARPSIARAAEERLAVWTTLRELTGALSPFTDRIRAALDAELGAAHRAELQAVEREHADRIAEAHAAADDEALQRLTDRLLSLSGFEPPAARRDNGSS